MAARMMLCSQYSYVLFEMSSNFPKHQKQLLFSAFFLFSAVAGSHGNQASDLSTALFVFWSWSYQRTCCVPTFS